MGIGILLLVVMVLVSCTESTSRGSGTDTLRIEATVMEFVVDTPCTCGLTQAGKAYCWGYFQALGIYGI